MCRNLGIWLVMSICVLPASAAAQSGLYAGGTVSATMADPGTLEVGNPFPAAGGLVGWRFNDAWSIEVQVDWGIAEGPPHGRIGHFGTDTLQDRAGAGYAVFGVWKSRPFGRISLATTMGLSERRYETEQTIGVDRPVNLPADDPLLQNKTRQTRAAGLTGGVLVPIRLAGRWSVGPEVRLAMRWSSDGIYGDGLYPEMHVGVRMMWGF